MSPKTGRLWGIVLAAPLAFVAALALAQPTLADAKGCSHQNARPGSVSANSAERAVFCLLNKQRSKRDIQKLARHRDLDRPSADHSQFMVREKCFDHVCPGEDDLADRLVDYFSGADGGYGYGENIAWGAGEFGSPRNIVQSWMKSDGHRANILDREYEHIGIGIVWGSPEAGVKGDAGTYTTDFGFRD